MQSPNDVILNNALPINTVIIGQIVFKSIVIGKSNCFGTTKLTLNTVLLQIVTVDARNHGDSDRSPHMSFSLMASDVYHLIQELQLSKVVLLANSMGAKTAMTFALTYPTSLDSLKVVDTSPSPKEVNLRKKCFHLA